AEARPAARGLEELYRTHAPDALRLAFLLTGDRAMAEDLAQDAFVKVLGRFHDLRNRDAFWWYLRRTVVNLSKSHFRRRKVERAWLDRQRPDVVVPAVGDDLGDRDRLRRALMTLRPEQRAAIVLRHYEDLSEADTAEALGVAVGTVKSMVSRGMERLRTELGEDEP
ncbi:MAG TPA: SigE family RNA polymerase sigma factor, partial [Actinomycetota bacterium]|nr:SigE family RNA polymerase sigma factor [Actinomycetota bacterium]